MANNVILPGTGQSVATIEDGSGNNHQQVLAEFLTGANPTSVTSVEGLPVNILSSAVAPLPIAQHYTTLDRGASPTPDIDSVSAQTFSSEIDCLGKSLIKIKGEASNATGTVPVRIWTKDANGNWEPSEVVTPANTGQQGGAGDVPATVETNYYHLAPITYPVEGATSYIIENTEVPSASASISLFGDEV
ncbi:MAG: hypothetical protein V3U75_13155 [Methylococcaceae bacterium]